MARLLLVEDDADLSEILTDALRVDGFRVDAITDGSQALAAVGEGYDVIILDRDLPGMSGDAICRALVAEGAPVRILMLTAAAELRDRVNGLELGADDYLSKPFAYPELVARLRALTRRGTRAAGSVIDRGRTRMDVTRRAFEIDGLPVALTPKEFDVLEALLRAERPLSTERLLASAWDDPYERTHGAVRVVIHALRKKVDRALRIEHTAGAGYLIEALP